MRRIAFALAAGAALLAAPAVQASGLDFFSVDVLLPIFLAFATLIILSIGLRQSRLLARRGVLLFLALCSLSLTACLTADYHLAASLPGGGQGRSPGRQRCHVRQG